MKRNDAVLRVKKTEVETIEIEVETVKGVTARQANYLQRVARASKGCNWAGSSYAVLEALVRKGLVTVELGNSKQWNRYTLTDHGRFALLFIREPAPYKGRTIK